MINFWLALSTRDSQEFVGAALAAILRVPRCK